MSRFLPPSKIVDAEIHNCIIGDGSLIKAGSTVSHSVVGLRSLINEDCTIADAMLMGSDYYETLDECEFVPGCLPMGVGAVRRCFYSLFFCLRFPLSCVSLPCASCSPSSPILPLLTPFDILIGPPSRHQSQQQQQQHHQNHPSTMGHRARPCAAPSSTRTRALARAA